MILFHSRKVSTNVENNIYARLKMILCIYLTTQTTIL